MRVNSHSNSPVKFSTIDQLYYDDLLPSLPEKKTFKIEEELPSTLKNNKLLFRFSSAEPS